MNKTILDRIFGRLNRFVNETNDALSRRFPLRPFSLPAGERIVSFTFDDVPDTAESGGARILERHGLRGTFYISGSLLGTEDRHRRLISPEGCRRLAAAGHDVGCHTFGHLNVPWQGSATLAADLDRNRACLGALDPEGPEPRNFAYPYCASSVLTRRLFADRFATCRSGGNRINRGRIDLAFLEAVEIRQPDGEAVENCQPHGEAGGLIRRIDELAARPGWLIFFTHDISATPSQYGCTPETFERLVTHAAQSGAKVLSIRDALAHLRATRGDA